MFLKGDIARLEQSARQIESVMFRDGVIFDENSLDNTSELYRQGLVLAGTKGIGREIAAYYAGRGVGSAIGRAILGIRAKAQLIRRAGSGSSSGAGHAGHGFSIT